MLLAALAGLTDTQWLKIEKVDIYGGGPEANMVHSKVAQLAAAKRPVHAHGYVSKFDAERIIESSDFLVIPSRIESIPLVFSDAAKLGCPVIVTPVGDLAPLVNKYKCGIISSGVSELELRTALISALNSNPQKFMQGLVKAAGEFDMERIASTLSELSDNSL